MRGGSRDNRGGQLERGSWEFIWWGLSTRGATDAGPFEPEPGSHLRWRLGPFEIRRYRHSTRRSQSGVEYGSETTGREVTVQPNRPRRPS